MNNDKTPNSQPRRSLRLIFSYEGNNVRLVSSKSIEMLSPPSDPITTQEGRSGFWYELRDAANHTLYRRGMQNPIKYFVEVRSSDPRRPLEWQKVNQPHGDFVLIVPELPLAETIRLFSSPLGHEATSKPAGELASYNLERSPTDKEEN